MTEEINKLVEQYSLPKLQVPDFSVLLGVRNSKPLTAEMAAREDHKKTIVNVLNFLTDAGLNSMAAPQLGIPEKWFIRWEKNNTPRIFYNPKYFPAEKKTEAMAERCISYGEDYFAIHRYKYIQASWEEYINGKMVKVAKRMRDLDAEIFQHGTDFCNGETIATKGMKLKVSGPKAEEVQNDTPGPS